MAATMERGQIYFDKEQDDHYRYVYESEKSEGFAGTRVYGVLEIGDRYKVDGVDMVDTTFGEVDLVTLEKSIRDGKLIPLDAREQAGKKPSNYDALIAASTTFAAIPSGQNDEKEMVYIASPLRGDVAKNVENAMRYCAQAVREGFIPIAPHAMYRGMFDDEVPAERAAALEIGLSLLQKCSCVWVCGDRISAGMQGEIDQAARIGLPVERKEEHYFQSPPPDSKLTFRGLRDAVERSMADYSTPEKIADLLMIKATHRRFGLSNALAIYRQRPNSSYTATYHEWHKLGYKVNDLRSIKVWTPIQSGRFLRDGVPTDTQEATSAERGAIMDGKLAVTPHTTYRMNLVYDITQTNCPASEYANVIGDPLAAATHTEQYAAMKQFAEKCGFAVSENAESSVALVNGYCRGDDITISSRIRDPQKLSALCAALSQGLIAQTSTQPEATQSFEANALSFLLQKRFGLPISNVIRADLANSLENASWDGKLSAEMCFAHVGKAENYVADGVSKEIVALGGEATAQKEMGLSQKQKQIHQNFINEID